MGVRVVIDTNVLISAAFWPGKPHRLLDLVRHRDVHCVTSDPLLAEFFRILTDPQKAFGLAACEAEEIVAEVRALATVVSPATSVKLCRDPDDDQVLECAVEGKVAYVVTGDKDLLDLGQFAGIPILSVAEFLDALAI